MTSCGSPGTNQRAVASLLSLAPGGVYRAAPVTRGAGGLLHHRFTLTCASCQGHRRSVLCGTFRRVAPPGRYPAPCPVESGLSSSAGECPHARGHPASSFFSYMLCPCCHGWPPVCQLGVGECLQGGGPAGKVGGQWRPARQPVRPPRTNPRAAADSTWRVVVFAPPLEARVTRIPTMTSPVSEP